jgi:hypothetical protein
MALVVASIVCLDHRYGYSTVQYSTHPKEEGIHSRWQQTASYYFFFYVVFVGCRRRRRRRRITIDYYTILLTIIFAELLLMGTSTNNFSSMFVDPAIISVFLGFPLRTRTL